MLEQNSSAFYGTLARVKTELWSTPSKRSAASAVHSLRYLCSEFAVNKKECDHALDYLFEFEADSGEIGLVYLYKNPALDSKSYPEKLVRKLRYHIYEAAISWSTYFPM